MAIRFQVIPLHSWHLRVFDEWQLLISWLFSLFKVVLLALFRPHIVEVARSASVCRSFNGNTATRAPVAAFPFGKLPYHPLPFLSSFIWNSAAIAALVAPPVDNKTEALLLLGTYLTGVEEIPANPPDHTGKATYSLLDAATDVYIYARVLSFSYHRMPPSLVATWTALLCKYLFLSPSCATPSHSDICQSADRDPRHASPALGRLWTVDCFGTSLYLQFRLAGNLCPFPLALF